MFTASTKSSGYLQKAFYFLYALISPLYLNFGIFFHLDTKSSVNEEYTHINDWLRTQNSILNFESLVEFKKFIDPLFDSSFLKRISSN